MIYTCESKGCHYLFPGSEHETACPDCGGKKIRPANRAERAEYFRRAAIYQRAAKQPG